MICRAPPPASSLLQASSASSCTTTITATRPSARRQPAVRVRVSTDDATETAAAAPPRVDFTPNTQAETGYVAYDTAGQENMYPVLTRPVEVGSEQDTLDTSSANLVVGVGAGFLAAAVVVVGLAALSQQAGSSGATDAALEGLKSLSEYAAAFSAEL